MTRTSFTYRLKIIWVNLDMLWGQYWQTKLYTSCTLHHTDCGLHQTSWLQWPCIVTRITEAGVTSGRFIDFLSKTGIDIGYVFGSDRSSGCHFVCVSVCPAPSCLEHSIFIFQPQILHDDYMMRLQDDFWKTSLKISLKLNFISIWK